MLTTPYLVIGALLIIYIIIMLAIIHYKQDPTIGNFTWGGVVMIIAVGTFIMTSPQQNRSIAITALMLFWGIRLAGYTYLRYAKGSDTRFTKWLNHTGLHALLFDIGWVVGANTFMGLIMSVPAVIINTQPTPMLKLIDIIALGIWSLGFIIESVADAQMYRFIRAKKSMIDTDAILDSGLWHYSRHPNYFGELLMWWAVFALCIAAPYGFYAIICPLAITTTLLGVSGIPWIEQAMKDNKRYQEYAKRTRVLIPWFPKK